MRNFDERLFDFIADTNPESTDENPQSRHTVGTGLMCAPTAADERLRQHGSSIYSERIADSECAFSTCICILHSEPALMCSNCVRTL